MATSKTLDKIRDGMAHECSVEGCLRRAFYDHKRCRKHYLHDAPSVSRSPKFRTGKAPKSGSIREFEEAVKKIEI